VEAEAAAPYRQVALEVATGHERRHRGAWISIAPKCRRRSRGAVDQYPAAKWIREWAPLKDNAQLVKFVGGKIAFDLVARC
jgi:hypothetical protein